VGVTLAHLWLAGWLAPDQLGEGAADTRPRRIEVAFVRELAPAAPTPVVRAPRPRRRAVPPAPAASAPVPAAQPAAQPAPDPPAPVVEAHAEPAPAAAEWPASAADANASMAAVDSTATAAAPVPGIDPLPLDTTAVAPVDEPVLAAAAAAAAASAPTTFEWPPSTRLSYRLSGNYRGPVEGQAQVEWLRSGTRYQVHMELSIGPAFSPLMSRRVSSEGEITPEGLRPSRYDEETRVVLRAPRRLVIMLDADRVLLPDGSELPRPPGVQDSASQFVQLTWLFTTQPELLQPGVSIEIPLALPRRLQTWIYDVMGPETLSTPAGEVPALRVKPRREPSRGSGLAAEVWVAPSLQYLPVRILIRQDAETYLDLLVERLPQQAEPGR
jgi:outer membrane biosynthesis protein TonB